MLLFSSLYDALDQTTKTSEKLAALEAYFRDAPPEDAAWALHFLTGRRPRRAVSHTRLRAWASHAASLPMWLIDECYEAVGDLSETIALLLPDPARPQAIPLHRVVAEHLLPLSRLGEDEKRAAILRVWASLPARQRFLFHKLISGSFRVGAARKLVVRALANVAGIDPGVMDHRLLGNWQPTASDYRALLADADRQDDPAHPYPFFLASQLDDPPEHLLGDIADWHAEWKWDGIRAQLIHRQNAALIWSRGEELVGGAFPELVELTRLLPLGTVLDGEILAWERAPLPFAMLQRRLNRKDVAPVLFHDVPVTFMAYDLLELDALDLRAEPLHRRLARLEQLVAPIAPGAPITLSPRVDARSWTDLAVARRESRVRGVEGIMLKRRASAYGVGRTRGDWWKWKIDPYTIDAVLTAAQHGSGKRASIYTDYTFSLWSRAGAQGELVTIAKAYSGLTNDELIEADAFIRDNTTGRHGPVRAVRPQLVFELAFEGIQESTRHKSGLALRFPRIARWRRDKLPKDADSIDTLRALASSTFLARSDGKEAS